MSVVVAPFTTAPAALSQTAPPTSVTITGHGWGHGRGLSQYGALGYGSGFATGIPWSHDQILAHFYGGTAAAAVSPTTPLTVWLKARDNVDLTVSTVNGGFYVDGLFVAPGSAARITRSGGQWMLYTSYGCGQTEVWSTPISSPSAVPAVAAAEDHSYLVGLCTSSGRKPYRGFLTLVDSAGLKTVNTVWVDDYIRGVVPAEVPTTWPAAAVRAQAVAARSYGLAQGGESGQRYAWAKTCDDTFCQVYGGASSEQPGGDAAVAATSGQVRRFGNGGLASTEFSSSSGGWTVGGSYPAVEDRGDAHPSNPNHSWTASLSTSAIAGRYAVGTFQGIEVIARNGLGEDGGRVLSLVVRGSAGSVIVTGDAFQSDFGLKSNWFSVVSLQPEWFLRNTSSSGVADVSRAFGLKGDQVLLCDWNGDGVDTPGVFRGGLWETTDSNLPNGPTNPAFGYGDPGDIAVCGDWTGEGKDTPGIVRNGAWYLRTASGAGPHQILVGYGDGSDIPVVGDWDGDRRDDLGVFRRGSWFLDAGLSGGSGEWAFGYGDPTDQPIAGDWNGDLTDSVGIVRSGAWFLRNAPRSGGGADVPPFGYGNSTDHPMTGDFDNNRTSTPAVVRGR
ncbi:MAG: SpoIID/LytB domain-containing protein [Acidimicrobiales bacterium]